MPRFRKRPVVIEAIQWHGDGDHPNVVLIPESVYGTINERSTAPGLDSWRWIGTLEGGHIVMPGDWIITGVQGEMYPCKPDIFELTYESVEAPAQAEGTLREFLVWLKACPGVSWEATIADVDHYLRELGGAPAQTELSADTWRQCCVKGCPSFATAIGGFCQKHADEHDGLAVEAPAQEKNDG